MMRSLQQRESVRRAVFILPFVLIGVIGVVAPLYVLSKPRFLPAVYRTSPSRIVPTPTVVCPGDTISYTVHVDVRHAPSQVMIVESWWSVDEGHTAVFDDSPLWVAYTEAVEFDRRFSNVVPALAPGRYELRSVAQEAGAEPSAFSVSFSVRGDC